MSGYWPAFYPYDQYDTPGESRSIDNGHITVPNRVWKVIVVLANGSNDLSRVTNSTRVIAVNTPNINTISTDWKQYRTSVDAYKGRGCPEREGEGVEEKMRRRGKGNLFLNSPVNLKSVTFSYIP